MGRPKDFFDYLKAKTEIDPSRQFDRTFWKSFQSEFGATKQNLPQWNWTALMPHLRWAVPTLAVVLCLVLVLPRWRTIPEGPILAESETVRTILENTPLFEDLDLFLGSKPLAELNDEEWNKLLEGEG